MLVFFPYCDNIICFFFFVFFFFVFFYVIFVNNNETWIWATQVDLIMTVLPLL